jgi:hypothetical protein
MSRIVKRFLGVPLIAVVIIGVVGCAPPSGLPDARQYDLGACGQFEVRLGGQTGGLAFVAVRQYGLAPPVPTGSGICRIVTLQLGTGPDSTDVTLHSCHRFMGTEGCDRYSAGAVGGTWYQLASSDGLLQSARIGLSDIPEEVATRHIDAYP